MLKNFRTIIQSLYKSMRKEGRISRVQERFHERVRNSLSSRKKRRNFTRLLLR